MKPMKRIKNPRRQGDVGVGSAIAWFTSQGQTVCIPLGECSDYDLIVDSEEGLKKVQVKTSRYKRHGHFAVTLATSGGNRSGMGSRKKFNPKSVDILFILTGDGERYCIPTKEMVAGTSILLRGKYLRYRLSGDAWS